MAARQQPLTETIIKAIFIAMLLGSVVIVVLAIFGPAWTGLEDDSVAPVFRLVFAAAAIGNTIQAFWVRAKLRKVLASQQGGDAVNASKSGTGTVQRQ